MPSLDGWEECSLSSCYRHLEYLTGSIQSSIKLRHLKNVEVLNAAQCSQHSPGKYFFSGCFKSVPTGNTSIEVLTHFSFVKSHNTEYVPNGDISDE